jgi:hypothetical protein
MPVILTLRRLRQEDHNLEASSGYIAKPCLKTKKIKTSIWQMLLQTQKKAIQSAKAMVVNTCLPFTQSVPRPDITNGSQY